ncbi:unnamed protein product [Linum trigynum]|uniref:Uncharacterized protein n=1 Tax=Linum trigynum TaxID=586398 RepID=A0AAV2EXD1_9ROSI
MPSYRSAGSDKGIRLGKGEVEYVDPEFSRYPLTEASSHPRQLINKRAGMEVVCNNGRCQAEIFRSGYSLLISAFYLGKRWNAPASPGRKRGIVGRSGRKKLGQRDAEEVAGYRRVGLRRRGIRQSRESRLGVWFLSG